MSGRWRPTGSLALIAGGYIGRMTFYMIRMHRVSFNLSSLSTLTVSTNLCYRAGGDSTELTIYWGMYDDSNDDGDDNDDDSDDDSDDNDSDVVDDKDD